MTQSLPEFDSPPVVEVAISVQFDPLGSFGVPQIGYVWHHFRDRFPRTDEQPPLDPTFEQFGPKSGKHPEVRIEFTPVPPRPRIWMLNNEGSELVQLQQDRFVRNWRKREEDAGYPHYSVLRELFREDFERFCCLVEREGWGSVQPNQCEVTYVNILPAGEGWEAHGDLEKVLTVFSSCYSDNQLQKPEEATVSVQYVLRENNEPIGRLYIVANPVLRVSDGQPAIRLTLTARGKPEGIGLEGAMRFLDRGHEAVVRGFASVTTTKMHEIWKRTS